MTEFNVDELVKELNGAGYFKESEDSSRGNVFRYNNKYGVFQELNNTQFVKILDNIIGSKKIAHQHWRYIKNNLNLFPSKEHKQYQKYIGLSKQCRFKSVEDDFLRRFYKENNNRKKETEITSKVSLNKDIQVLINNDIFTDGKDLYKYDLDNKTFILVTKDNIGSLINCNDNEIATKILETGLKNNHVLINIDTTVYLFNKAKNVDYNLNACRGGYEYIIELIGSFNIKFEDTF